MKIITIGREFGSGGRELGKRLADALNIPCYDKEILHEVAKIHGVETEYIDQISQAEISIVYPTTIGGTLYSPIYYNKDVIDNLVTEQEVIRKLAEKGDCVFVGRSADVILKDMNPFNIFVYASEESKLNRCLKRTSSNETKKEILKEMKKIDKARANNRHLITDSKWADKSTYHLCINTTNIEIKDIIPSLVNYIESWFNSK